MDYAFYNVENVMWEKRGVSAILISLLDLNSEVSVSKLLDITKMSNPTFYDRKDGLVEAGLIKIKERPTERKNGVTFGKTVYISLTPKGKKVAKKLLEIKEIMNREG